MKTEFKGTPGPWKYVHQNHCTKPTGQGQRYAVMAKVINYLTRPDERWVFNIKLDKTEDLDLHREAEANAHLISASPELFIALENFVNSCYSGCTKEQLTQLRIDGEKALNKALGKPLETTQYQYKTKHDTDWIDCTESEYEAGKHLAKFEFRQITK